MKNNIIFKSVVILALAGVLTACSDDNTSGADEIFVSPDSLSLDGSAAEKELSITASMGTTWSVTSDADWITFSASSGQGSATIVANVETNTYGAERRASIIFLVGEAHGPVVNVTQQPRSNARLNVSPLFLTFGADGLDSGQMIEVDTDLTSWECHTDADWIKLTPDVQNGRVLVQVTENPYTKKQRMADFTISAPGMDGVSVAVTQEKNYINRLLGEWNVSGEIFMYTAATIAFYNDHVVTITKIDPTTVRIDNVMNINKQVVELGDYDEAEYGTYCDFITATVDSENKRLNIDIPYKLSYRWYNDKYDIYYSRMDSEVLETCFVENVWSIKIEEVNGTLEMDMTGDYIYPYTVHRGSFCSLAVYPETQEYAGGFAFTLDAKWVKQYDYNPNSIE